MTEPLPEERIMNLEELLLLTGEMEHLLVLLCDRTGREHVEAGAAEGVLDEVIFPLLADLAAYLRGTLRPAMDTAEVKDLISCWIEARRNTG
jgi:hypothetical protein